MTLCAPRISTVRSRFARCISSALKSWSIAIEVLHGDSSLGTTALPLMMEQREEWSRLMAGAGPMTLYGRVYSH
jgi:hypothetical protein